MRRSKVARRPAWRMARASMTSPNKMGTLTTAGCMESRAKASSVNWQVAQPSWQCCANQVWAAAWWTWVGQARARRTFTSRRSTDDAEAGTA